MAITNIIIVNITVAILVIQGGVLTIVELSKTIVLVITGVLITVAPGRERSGEAAAI